MSFKVAKPSPILSPYIKQFWTIENCLMEGESYVQRIVPNGLMELTFYFCQRPEALQTGKSLPDNSFISGQIKKPYDLKISGDISLFSVSFQPLGPTKFFKLPIKELFELNVPLRFLMKDRINQLESELFEAQSFKDRIILVEKFFMELLKKDYESAFDNRIIESIKTINYAKGVISVDKLAEVSCLSRKQFERVFNSSIGITPKSFLKVVRFQNSIFQKQVKPDFDLTELAYECGYYDQSHMINDFQKLAGMTPKDYFTDCEPYSDYFTI